MLTSTLLNLGLSPPKVQTEAPTAHPQMLPATPEEQRGRCQPEWQRTELSPLLREHEKEQATKSGQLSRA